MRPIEEPVLCRVIRRAVDLVYPNMELVGLENLPETPCVLVGNHAQAHGAIITEERLPFDHYTWCASQMMNRAEVADYAFADFWSKKPDSIRWLYWIISRVIPIPASYILSHARTIPVYRDSRCMATFKKSIEKLQTGYSLVIFPEHDVPFNHILCEFQDRFIDLARIYYRKTGVCLSFVPMYLAPKLKKIIFGAPVTYVPDTLMSAERQRICTYLMDTITQIALSQPRHTVVPYPNIPKRDYPQNLPVEADHETSQI